MAQKFIALFLALLIGNPVCCCAAVDLFAGEDENSSKVYSCCGSSDVFGEDQGDPKKPDSCPCFADAEEVVSIKQPSVQKGSAGEFASITCSHIDCSFILPKAAVSLSSVSKWPPGFLPISSLSERLALQSSYLL